MDHPLESYTINVPEGALDDLRDRLARTRWPDEEPGIGWGQGTDLAYLRELVEYWRTRFDWRAREAALNQFSNFRATIDGIGIHFIHQPGRGPDPLPLILTHGWPGSFADFTKLIPLLTDPQAHGGDAADAFDVVVPSLPGYGFSDRPPRLSPPFLHDLWASLMTDVLGYERFGAQGGDIGSGPTTKLARFYPERMVGIHINSDAEWPDPEPTSDELSDRERAFLARSQEWDREDGAYAHIQGTRPQTLAYGLSDSPAGLAAWIVEKFRAWGDTHGDLERSFSRDELLENITIYWVTATINSANRYYWRSRHPQREAILPGTPITVPAGFSQFFAEGLNEPREWIERVYTNVTRWTDMPRGGHFAAREEPELLAHELREFFRPLRSSARAQRATLAVPG